MTVNLVHTLRCAVRKVKIMTIKEAEEQTGLSRSNIRFYEKEKLIQPKRRESSGYRDYSRKDVEEIRKIAYLRTLGFPIEEIRKIIEGKVPLRQAVQAQCRVLEGQMEELAAARTMCEKMLEEEQLSYEQLDIGRYVPEVRRHWRKNRGIFKGDAVGFFYLWGGMLVWGLLTVICLVIALIALPFLPPEIPVQWRADGTPASLLPRYVILAYPAASLLIRFLLRPALAGRLWCHGFCAGCDSAADFISNYLCFVLITVEVFTIANGNGFPLRITTVLLLDVILLLAGLGIGAWRLKRRKA